MKLGRILLIAVALGLLGTSVANADMDHHKGHHHPIVVIHRHHHPHPLMHRHDH